MNALLLAPEGLLFASAWNDIWIYTLRGLFFFSAVLLMVIVLLQEGKGGGLAAALGGQGAETFGVATGGVNKVTLTLAGIFLLSGVFHAVSFEHTATAALRKEALERGTKREGGAKPLDIDGIHDGEGEDGGDDGMEEGADEGSHGGAGGKAPPPPEKTPPGEDR